jgi:phospholipid/cholesterol/gamma-HCH transport system substrate-binding protein
VGVLVAAAVILLLFLAFLFGGFPQMMAGQYTLFIHFPSAPGVSESTPVRKSGILIGRVERVELQETGGVLVTAKIDRGRKLYRNEVVRIRTGTIFGDAMLEFVPGEQPVGPDQLLTDESYLNGIVTGDPLDAMQVVVNLEADVRRALGSVGTAGDEVGLAAQNLNQLMQDNQEQLSRVLTSAEQVLVRADGAMARFDRAMTGVSDILDDEELNLRLREALRDLPRLMEDAGALLVGLQQVATEAETNLRNLQGLTEPLGREGEQIVSSARRSMERLDAVLEQLSLFGAAVNQPEGSLGRLVNDPALYQKMLEVMDHLEELTVQLRPAVHDLRVFADKIARDPGRLSTGVLQRRATGIK